jgi:hypothetical protein
VAEIAALDQPVRGALYALLVDRSGWMSREDARDCQLACGMNLELLTGPADGLDSSPRLDPRLEPQDGMCCVRIRRAEPATATFIL